MAHSSERPRLPLRLLGAGLRLLDRFQQPSPVHAHTITSVINQSAFRGRNDDGSETTATWKAAENTNWSQAVGENFRVRFELEETAGGNTKGAASCRNQVNLQYNLNGAGWNNVSGSSSVVRLVASSQFAGPVQCTDQMTTSGASFLAGSGCALVESLTLGTIAVPTSQSVQYEFCLQIVAADVTNGQTIQLRALSVNTSTGNGEVLDTYTNTPTITVVEGTTVTIGAASLTTSRFAPIVVTSPRIIRPNGAGTYAEFGEQTPNDGTPHWQLVDEESSDGDTTRLFDNSWSGTERESYNLEASLLPAGSAITKITVHVVAKAEAGDPAGANALKHFIRSGTTDSESSAFTLTTSYAEYTHDWTTDPATGSAWTKSAVDALEAGFRNAMPSSVPWGVAVTQVWVEVFFENGNRQATPTTASLTASRFAPTVTTPRLVTPGVLSLSDTQFAPSSILGYRSTPGVLNLSDSQFAPSIVLGYIFTPAALGIVDTQYAPTVLTPRTATPGKLTLSDTQYPPKVTPADVVINPNDAHASSPHNRHYGRVIAWVSSTVGYVFWVDTTDISYSKTTDGGETWSNNTGITIQTGNTMNKLTIWYDQWTPGDSGTKIHIWWTDTTTDDLWYASIDTSDDTVSTPLSIASSSADTSASANMISGAKSRGGNLYIAAVANSGSTPTSHFYKSTDGGANWSSLTSPLEVVGDTFILFPGNETDTNDMWLVYHDASALEVTLKTYDDSADSWSESSAFVTGLTYFGAQFWAGSIRHSDNHLIFVVQTERDTATADLLCFDINGASSITQKTDVITNADDWTAPAVFINQDNDDIYVLYIGKSDGSENLAYAVSTGVTGIYYKKSSDDAATWDAEGIISGNLYDHAVLFCDLGAGQTNKLIAVWDDLSDLTWRVNPYYAPTLSSAVTVTPDAASLSDTQFAAVVVVNNIAVPGVLALSDTQFAPSVLAPRLVTPGVLALVDTQYAPTVSAPRLVTPGLLALTTSRFAPSALAPRLVTVSLLALATSTFAPIIDVSDGQAVVVGQLSVSTAAFAPTVSTPRLVTPGVLSVNDTQYAPSAIVGYRFTPSTLAVTTSRFAPTISAPRLVTPGVLALSDTQFAPAVSTSGGVIIGVASLVTVQFAPNALAPRLVTPGVLSLADTQYAPTAFATDAKLVTPSTAALTAGLLAPVIVTTANIIVPSASMLIELFDLTAVGGDAHQLVIPSTELSERITAAQLRKYPPSFTSRHVGRYGSRQRQRK